MYLPRSPKFDCWASLDLLPPPPAFWELHKHAATCKFSLSAVSGPALLCLINVPSPPVMGLRFSVCQWGFGNLYTIKWLYTNYMEPASKLEQTAQVALTHGMPLVSTHLQKGNLFKTFKMASSLSLCQGFFNVPHKSPQIPLQLLLLSFLSASASEKLCTYMFWL